MGGNCSAERDVGSITDLARAAVMVGKVGDCAHNEQQHNPYGRSFGGL